eukprot:7478280-Pyramimonas_sp.AAC.1
MFAKSCDKQVVNRDGSVTTTAVNQSSSYQADRDRYIVSHARAQARGLSEFCQAGNNYMLQFSTVFDDASMWVGRPPQSDYDQLVRDLAGPIQKKMRKSEKGGNMAHTPVLNICESVFKMWNTDNGQSTCAAAA